MLLFVVLLLPSYPLGGWVVGGYTNYDEHYQLSVVTSEDSILSEVAGPLCLYPL